MYLNDRFVEMSLIVKLQGSQNGNSFVLRIGWRFRQNFSGLFEPALRMEVPRLHRKRELVPRRNLQNAIEEHLCLIEPAEARERLGGS